MGDADLRMSRHEDPRHRPVHAGPPRYFGARDVAPLVELRGLLAALGAEWLVDEKTTSSDANRSKPDPDIVRVAVDKAGVGPAQCVMLGDTPYDVEAASRAGIPVIAFRSGGWLDSELAAASAIYDGPADLLANYDTSPIGLNLK